MSRCANCTKKCILREGIKSCSTCRASRRAWYRANRESQRAEKRALRAELRSLGLCQTCGKREIHEDFSVCGPCHEVTLRNSKERYRRRRSSGACTYCGGRRDAGFPCSTCKVKYLSGTTTCPCGQVKHRTERLCAFCTTVSKSGKKTPYVVKSLLQGEWKRLNDITKEASVSWRNALRIVQRLVKMRAVDVRESDESTAKLYRMKGVA